MLSFGGSLAIHAVFLTRANVPLLLLVATYTQLSAEGNGPADQLVLTDAGGTALANVSSTYDGAAPAAPKIKVPPSDCKKLRMVLAKRFTKVIRKCSLAMQQVYPDKEEYRKHFQCVLQCTLLDVQAVEKEGLRMTNETLQNFMDAQVPVKYHATLFPLVLTCLNDWGSKLDPGDEFCVNMGNLFKCVQNEISECQGTSSSAK